MTSSSEVRALSIGPAAALALTAGVTLRVHGVFPSAWNLQIEATQDFVSLVGPGGADLPHAVVLERAEHVRAWSPADGTPVRCDSGTLRVQAAASEVRIDLRPAARLPRRTLPSITSLGAAHAACERRLAGLQAAAGTDLRIESLAGAGAPATPLGTPLTTAALGLVAAARTPAALPRAVPSLLGLGPGLTPSGDDLLSGYLAGTRASSRAALADALGEAIERDLSRTTAVSAFLLRCAVRGFWLGPLVDLAEALAAEREPDALAALGALCALGHSSGADLATGFLLGLRTSSCARQGEKRGRPQ